jgi:hypothetical protein
VSCPRPRVARWPAGSAPTSPALRSSTGIVASDLETNTTIWRWLAADEIKPWQHRSWIFPRGPAFALKAGRVLDLYARRWQGKPLGKRKFVISADEKTSIQARVRRHTTTPPAPGQPMRVEHEYRRGGALAYLAAFDVHRAKIFGRCGPTSGIEPFGRLVEQVMTTRPYASATRVLRVPRRFRTVGPLQWAVWNRRDGDTATQEAVLG